MSVEPTPFPHATIPDSADPFALPSLTLKHVDLSSPEEMFLYILSEWIVVQDSVDICW